MKYFIFLLFVGCASATSYEAVETAVIDFFNAFAYSYMRAPLLRTALGYGLDDVTYVDGIDMEVRQSVRNDVQRIVEAFLEKVKENLGQEKSVKEEIFKTMSNGVRDLHSQVYMGHTWELIFMNHYNKYNRIELTALYKQFKEKLEKEGLEDEKEIRERWRNEFLPGYMEKQTADLEDKYKKFMIWMKKSYGAGLRTARPKLDRLHDVILQLQE